jgi:hypothetical protein
MQTVSTTIKIRSMDPKEANRTHPWHRKLKKAHPEEVLFFQSLPETVRQNLWVELQTAAKAFGLPPAFTRADVETAFRRLARKMHPDAGGSHNGFQNLVSQRDLLLSQVRT